MAQSVCIALDFGGTKLAAGLVDLETGAIYQKLNRKTPVAGGRDASLKAVLEMVREGLLSWLDSEPAGKYQLVGVGVSFGGHVDSVRGLVEKSMHVPGWEAFPLASFLTDTFALPVAIDNDANAVALGLKHYGQGKAYERFIYVTVSTGVGGALVLGDDVFPGKHNLAGEIGHMVMQEDGPLCSCGKRGCLEALASGPAIARAARRRWEARPASARADGFFRAELRAEDVFDAARMGDPLAKGVIEQSAKCLGRGISYAVNLVDPDAVMIGGGVSQGGEEWFQTVAGEVYANVLPAVAQDLRVLRVEESADAALAGTSALVRARVTRIV